jgi:hypothetical protein
MVRCLAPTLRQPLAFRWSRDVTRENSCLLARVTEWVKCVCVCVCVCVRVCVCVCVCVYLYVQSYVCATSRMIFSAIVIFCRKYSEPPSFGSLLSNSPLARWIQQVPTHTHTESEPQTQTETETEAQAQHTHTQKHKHWQRSRRHETRHRHTHTQTLTETETETEIQERERERARERDRERERERERERASETQTSRMLLTSADFSSRFRILKASSRDIFTAFFI